MGLFKETSSLKLRVKVFSVFCQHINSLILPFVVFYWHEAAWVLAGGRWLRKQGQMKTWVVGISLFNTSVPFSCLGQLE